MDIVAIIGFSTVLEPLWGIKEFMVMYITHILITFFCELTTFHPLLHVQIFSGVVGVVSLVSGVLATVILYAVSQSYSFL